jgi:hypothetical protein
VGRPFWREVASVVFGFCCASSAQPLSGLSPEGTHEHILLSLFWRLPQPGGSGSCIYFPQDEGSPVMAPGIRLTPLLKPTNWICNSGVDKIPPIWHTECEKQIQGRLTSSGVKRSIKIYVSFCRTAGGQWHRTSRGIHISLRKREWE